jgi:hypothetical protein
MKVEAAHLVDKMRLTIAARPKGASKSRSRRGQEAIVMRLRSSVLTKPASTSSARAAFA